MSNTVDVARERFIQKRAQAAPPVANSQVLEQLLRDGYRLLLPQGRAGSFLSIRKKAVALSSDLKHALGDPRAIQLFMKDDALVIAPCHSDDRGAFHVTVKGPIGGRGLRTLFADAGWPTGQYRATVESGLARFSRNDRLDERAAQRTQP